MPPVLHTTSDIKTLQQQISLYEDMKAYETLYGVLSPQLKNFCYSFVKSGEAAEEIVSDVFIKLWQIRNKLSEIENLKVYLYTIAKNFCLNYIARNFKNPVIRLDEMDIEPVVSVGNPEDLCISADVVNQIQLCIRELPQQCRIIFQLVKEDGMSYKETAGILNISVLTVRNQVFIATRKIAALIPAYLQSKVMHTGRRSAS
ncbi:MAG: RNA polymerase sigma-70 factor [Bacteroidota bacterium]